MQTNQAPKLPTEFFAQLLARFFAGNTPKFFRIIRNVSGGIAVLSAALNALPADVVTAYRWVGVLNSTVVSVSAVVAALVAQLTITTPSTPPVGDDQLPKP